MQNESRERGGRRKRKRIVRKKRRKGRTEQDREKYCTRKGESMNNRRKIENERAS